MEGLAGERYELGHFDTTVTGGHWQRVFPITLSAIFVSGERAERHEPARGMMGGVNRLGAATSPYLLQHAGNPVDWWEWGGVAFEEARRRDVPILLSVGYSSCHWCHVAGCRVAMALGVPFRRD